jgi:predicted secreted hydrolase
MPVCFTPQLLLERATWWIRSEALCKGGTLVERHPFIEVEHQHDHLSYSMNEPVLRSPVEEWQPHAKQTESTTEWWHMTAVVHDTVGNPYFLVWCPFHFTGEKASPASAGLRRDQRAIAALTGFTDDRDNFHVGSFPAAVVNEADTWEARINALRFAAGDYSSEWSYEGDSMHLTVASPLLSYDLRLTGAGQVMYAKDKLGIEGFIQEGAKDDRSYYYLLPRLDIVGRITYSGKGGVRREIDVTGQGGSIANGVTS